MEWDESQSEPLVSPDTEERTRFNPEEADPEHRAKFERLFKYNTGVYNGEWADESKRRRMDNLAIYDAISSQLELTPFQKRRGRELFDSLNLRRLGYPAEMVAFCVCVAVAREDGREYHPFRADRNNDEVFLELAEDLGFRTKQIASCLNRVQKVIE